jgi:hypothetical protein
VNAFNSEVGEIPMVDTECSLTFQRVSESDDEAIEASLAYLIGRFVAVNDRRSPMFLQEQAKLQSGDS